MHRRFDNPRFAVDELLLTRVPALMWASGRKSSAAFARELCYSPRYWTNAKYYEREILSEPLARMLIALMLKWGVISREELHRAIGRARHATKSPASALGLERPCSG